MGQLTDDVLKWTLDINGDPARKELTEVGNTTNKLERDNRALSTEMAKLEAHGKKGSDEWKKYEAQVRANSTTIATNKTRMEQLRKEVGLTNLSSTELRKEMGNLKRQFDRMDPNTSEYKKLRAEWEAMNSRSKQLTSGVNSVNGVFGQLKEMLPFIGFAAFAAGAGAAIKKVINSTDELGTRWESQLKGMKMASDEFFRTIATGNWSNFLTRMNEAIKTGKEYVLTLDDVEEKTRALSIIEANARAEELALEEKLKNKGLSPKDRLKAGQDRIKLEQDLAKKRTEIAQQVYDAELSVSMQESKLSKEQLEIVMSDFNSIDKQQAKSYIETKKRFDDLMQSELVFRDAQGRGVNMANPFTKQLEETKIQLTTFPDSVKKYAESVSGAGRTTDEQLNKTVDAWVRLKEAQNSSVENIKKVRTQVNTLLAGEEENGNTVENKALKNALNIIDSAHADELLRLKQYYSDKEQLEKEYKARLLASELAYLQTKERLEPDQLKKIGLQSQIIDKQKEYTAALKEAVPEILLNRDGINALNKTLLEESKLFGYAAKKQAEGAEASEELKVKTENQRDMILSMSEALSQSMYDLASGGEDALKQAGKNILLFALDMLKTQAEIAIAGATIQSLAQPDSVATFGATGLIRAAILVGLIEAAFAGVKGLVVGAFDSKGKQSGGYADAYGSDNQPAGIYHKNEFIVSAPAVRNQTVKPILDIIDMAQRSGTIRSLNLSALVPAGYSQGSGSTKSESGSLGVVSTDVLNRMAIALENNEKQMASNERQMARIENWNPELIISEFERKRDNWRKTTTGGLK